MERSEYILRIPIMHSCVMFQMPPHQKGIRLHHPVNDEEASYLGTCDVLYLSFLSNPIATGQQQGYRSNANFSNPTAPALFCPGVRGRTDVLAGHTRWAPRQIDAKDIQAKALSQCASRDKTWLERGSEVQFDWWWLGCAAVIYVHPTYLT